MVFKGELHFSTYFDVKDENFCGEECSLRTINGDLDPAKLSAYIFQTLEGSLVLQVRKITVSLFVQYVD